MNITRYINIKKSNLSLRLSWKEYAKITFPIIEEKLSHPMLDITADIEYKNKMQCLSLCIFYISNHSSIFDVSLILLLPFDKIDIFKDDFYILSLAINSFSKCSWSKTSIYYYNPFSIIISLYKESLNSPLLCS